MSDKCEECGSAWFTIEMARWVMKLNKKGRKTRQSLVRRPRMRRCIKCDDVVNDEGRQNF